MHSMVVVTLINHHFTIGINTKTKYMNDPNFIRLKDDPVYNTAMNPPNILSELGKADMNGLPNTHPNGQNVTSPSDLGNK